MAANTKPRCEVCYNSLSTGGQLICRLNPKPEYKAPNDWCSHFNVGPTRVNESEVDAALEGLDKRRVVRAALWALKRLEKL